MRLNDEKMQAAREARIRAIVREEIVAALQVLGRAADSEYRATESEIAERSATTVGAVAENAVVRLTCKHEKYTDWGSRSYCSRCGEPEPEPVNPFEPEHEHTYDISEGTPTDCIECGAPYPTKEG